MTDWRLPAASAIFFLIGFAVTPEQIVLLAGLELTPHRIERIHQGVWVLKSLLVADGAILLTVWLLFFRSSATTVTSLYSPLWTPVQQQAALWGGPRPYWPAVLVLLALASGLRVISLNSDLWIDEVFTLVNFVRLPMGEIVSNYASDNQHVFYSVLARVCIVLWGDSAWSLRLPAVIFGVASIWAAMRLATLVYGSRVAIGTGLLLTLSYHHIWFSQNARGYTLLLFGTILATDLFLRGLQSGKWRYWIMYSVVIGLSAWSHLTAVFVAIAHGIVISILLFRQGGLNRGRWRGLAALALSMWVTLHLYALVLPQMLEYFTRPGAGTGLIQTDWRTPLWLFNEIIRSMGIGIRIGWVELTAVSLLSALCLYWFAKRDWVFVMLVILPGLLLGFTMFALGRNLWPRMFFNNAGFAIMLIVAAAVVVGDMVNRRLFRTEKQRFAAWPVIPLALIMVVSLPGLYRYPKQDFSGARDFVNAQLNQGDQVLGLHIAGRVFHEYYAPEWPVVESVQQLNQGRSKNGRTWVLYTLPGNFRAERPALARAVMQEFDFVRAFPGTLGDGMIVVAKSRLLPAEGKE